MSKTLSTKTNSLLVTVFFINGHKQLQRLLLNANVEALVPCVRIFSVGAKTGGVLVASTWVSVASEGNESDMLLSIKKQ
jgi:hypothetical protein